MTALTIDQLTTATVDGNGVFDVLMQATKAHLEAEYSKDRIKGAEYATVYLGSLESVMQNSLAFLLQREKISLESQLLAKQVEIADLQLQKAQVELDMLIASQAKIPAEIALLEQQKINLVSENLLTQAKTTTTNTQNTNLVAEGLNIPKQGLMLDAQRTQIINQAANLAAEKLLTDAKAALTNRQTANAVIEADVLNSNVCKLKAEFDVLKSTDLKVQAETGLLNQKNQTEKAQITALGVDDNSVVGRQKLLYKAQTDGFSRDAEQKAAKLLVDTWNVRRTTDEGTVADSVNMLNDATVGRAVNKLLTGVGA